MRKFLARVFWTFRLSFQVSAVFTLLFSFVAAAGRLESMTGLPVTSKMWWLLPIVPLGAFSVGWVMFNVLKLPQNEKEFEGTHDPNFIKLNKKLDDLACETRSLRREVERSLKWQV